MDRGFGTNGQRIWNKWTEDLEQMELKAPAGEGTEIPGGGEALPAINILTSCRIHREKRCQTVRL